MKHRTRNVDWIVWCDFVQVVCIGFGEVLSRKCDSYEQVSGRLFDPVLRRSSRLAGESKSSVLPVGSVSTSSSAPGSPSGSGGSGLYALAGASGSTARASSASTLQATGVRKGLPFGSAESNTDEGTLPERPRC